MRPCGSPKTLEKRRRKAIDLVKEGLNLTQAAAVVGVSVSSVSRWKQAFDHDGEKGIAAKAVPGRPRKLDTRECERLLKILSAGALASGFPNEIWTLRRMAQVIEKKFDVQYHPSHLWRVLQRLGWSCQVPERRAIQRDDEAVELWKSHRWPKLKKTARTWRPPRVSRRKRVPPHPDTE
jgi:transposase